VTLTNMSSQLLWVPTGSARSTSVTLVPPEAARWTFLDVQLVWLGAVRSARAYCDSYRYVVGGQGGNVIDATLVSGWVEGLAVANFTLVVEGDGYAAAVAKLTTFR
jgi:hypothetical protein